MLKKNIILLGFFSIFVTAFITACSSYNKPTYVNKPNVAPNQLSTNIIIAETEQPSADLTYDEAEISQPGVESPQNTEKRSTYSTKFNMKDKARANNISVAVNSINGIVLQPNEVFSYNNTVGPTIKRRGYKSARIFINGKDSKGYGGGVCQVSSTLYNTADLFGLEIIERHPHSKEVKYVPKDRDAATSYGGVDLKFKNNRNYPVRIEAYVDNETVTVDMVGLS